MVETPQNGKITRDEFYKQIADRTRHFSSEDAALLVHLLEAADGGEMEIVSRIRNHEMSAGAKAVVDWIWSMRGKIID